MLIVGTIQKTLGLGTRKVIGCFKQGLMSHPSKSMEGSGAEDYRDPVQEVSQGNNISK